MRGATPPARSGGQNRNAAESVAVRDARGRLVCHTTPEQADAVIAKGAGRLVAGGRVLRIGRGEAFTRIVGEASITSRLDSRTTGAHAHIGRRCDAFGPASREAIR